jgi:hypothetical protein
MRKPFSLLKVWFATLHEIVNAFYINKKEILNSLTSHTVSNFEPDSLEVKKMPDSEKTFVLLFRSLF